MDTRNNFLEHLHELKEYPARIPYGALLKIDEILEAGFSKDNIYIADENIKVEMCDPFLIVCHSQYLKWQKEHECYLVYGWKDKKDDRPQ